MSFLVWTDKKKADASLIAINAIYGCPYVAENGYRMDQWDFIVKARTTNDHGFFAPEERLGKVLDALMNALSTGYVEYTEEPSAFYSEDEDDNDL